MQKVYLIRSGDDYKIGRTKRDVHQRIKELRTGSAQEQELIAVFESEWATKIEARLHRIHRSRNVSGEWFSLTGNVKEEFLGECRKIHDIFCLLQRENEWFQDNI